MKYFVSRDGREYGPYTPEELREYIGQNRVGLHEPAREARDGGRSFGSVSEVLEAAENVPEPPQAPPAPPVAPEVPVVPQVPGGVSPYAAPATWQAFDGAPVPAGSRPAIPMPSSMHWGVLLGLSVASYIPYVGPIAGLVLLGFMFQQAAYGKKVNPSDQTTLFYGLFLGLAFLSGVVNGVTGGAAVPSAFGSLIIIVAGVLLEVGHFKLRATLQNAFGLRLSPVVTFFFAPLYFQYHMSRVAAAMKEGRSY